MLQKQVKADNTTSVFSAAAGLVSVWNADPFLAGLCSQELVTLAKQYVTALDAEDRPTAASATSGQEASAPPSAPAPGKDASMTIVWLLPATVVQLGLPHSRTAHVSEQ